MPLHTPPTLQPTYTELFKALEALIRSYPQPNSFYRFRACDRKKEILYEWKLNILEAITTRLSSLLL